MKTIYFITGASGTGKTTLVDELKKKYDAEARWRFIHFDSIGIPSLEEMEEQYGSPSNWQRVTAFKWIGNLIESYDAEKIFFEGQVDPSFIFQAFEKYHFRTYHVVLIDCSEEEMSQRLRVNRAQPELFTPDMKNWLRYLRQEATRFRVPVIDTTGLSIAETVEQFEKSVSLNNQTD